MPQSGFQPLNLLLQLGDAPLAFLEFDCHVGRIESLRDVLRAVGVPGIDVEQQCLLALRLVAGGHEAGDERRIVVNSGRSPQLDPAPGRIVDQEQVRLRVLGEVAGSDELPIAAKIGEGDGLVVEHPQEPRRSATMLDVGLAVGVGGAEEDAGLCGDKCGKLGRDRGRPAALAFHAGVGITRALAGLDGLDAGRKGDIAGDADVIANFVHGHPLRCGTQFNGRISRMRCDSGASCRVPWERRISVRRN